MMNDLKSVRRWRAISIPLFTVAAVTVAFVTLVHSLSGAARATPTKDVEIISISAALSSAGVVTTTDLLAIYALAFDNDSADAMNLSLYYTSTVEGIVEATLNAPDKTAIILADLDGLLDTHILLAQDGQLIPVEGLPIAAPTGTVPVLDDLTDEYDMANGEELGHFLQWARGSFSANVTTFSYLGHGAPLVPEVVPTPTAVPAMPEPLPSATASPQPTVTPTSGDVVSEDDALRVEPVPPLPSRALAHSGFTDFNSASLLSIHALATALDMATDGGANPFHTVDLVQCFASSIEELYELYPYTETITGSPNYAYSKPEMIGTALGTISASMTAAQIADTFIRIYDEELPPTEHPRLLVAVDSSKVEPIKESWDRASFHLSELLATDRQATRNKITNAYDASAKYDTTLCGDPDWRLETPDSVSDMSDFAQNISQIFGPTSPAGSWAITTTQRIDDAIIARYARNGVPWFALVDQEENDTRAITPVEWTFDGPGISLYTDFGAAVNTDIRQLDWFSAWYTDTANIPHLGYANPSPYAFLTGGHNEISWADVFSQYWENKTFGETRCEPAFLAGRGFGELSILNFLPTTTGNLVVAADSTVQLPIYGEDPNGELISFSAQISTTIEAVNPQVRFNVYNSVDEQIYAEGVSAGYLEAGETKQIESDFRWPVRQAGTYTFEVILDADERFIENNEDDNIVRYSVEIQAVNTILRLPLIIQ